MSQTSNSKKKASHEKMKVVVKPQPDYGGKLWAEVTFNWSKKWIPSFEDLHRIIQAIGHCEDVKYPNGKGREMVAEFLNDAVYEPDYERLREKYQIPERLLVASSHMGGDSALT